MVVQVAGLEMLEEGPDDEQPADVVEDKDDSKYLHGPDFEQGEGRGDPEPDSVGGEEAAAVQASASELVPSFDEEDPDA